MTLNEFRRVWPHAVIRGLKRGEMLVMESPQQFHPLRAVLYQLSDFRVVGARDGFYHLEKVHVFKGMDRHISAPHRKPHYKGDLRNAQGRFVSKRA